MTAMYGVRSAEIVNSNTYDQHGLGANIISNQSSLVLEDSRYNSRYTDDGKVLIGDQQKILPSSAPLKVVFHSIQPELYHITSERRESDNSKAQPPPTTAFQEKQPVSIPYQPLPSTNPEMYHIAATGQKPAEPIQKPRINNSLVTTYMITTNPENVPQPSTQGIPLSTMAPNSGKLNVASSNGNYHDRYGLSNRSDYVTPAPQGGVMNFHYVPLSPSKSTASIRRSMDRYRFAEN